MTKARPGPLRRSIQALGSWTLPVLVSLLLFELVARFALGVQPLTTESIVWRDHDRWGWFHEPNSEDKFVKPGFAQHIAINERGLRERPLPYEKAPGTFRVLVIGDSSVVSFEVPPDAVFLRRAEDRLRASGYPVEFVNGGVRGYGSDQALLFLEDEGLKYQPDLVLYKWTDNDREDNATIHRPFRKFGKPWFAIDDAGTLSLRGVPVPRYPYAQNLRVGDDGEPMELPVSLRTAGLLWMRDHVLCRSAFGTALVKVALSLPRTKQTIVTLGSYQDKPDVQNELHPEDSLFRTTVAIVRRMRASSEAAGAQFRMIGVRGAFGRAVARDAGIPPLDDTDRFHERRPEDEPVQMPFDPHLNELGHQIYGDAVAEALLAAGLLPPPAP